MGRGPTVAGRKNAEDARRGKVFTKLIREITVATRQGVADPALNARLQTAVEHALAANMPKDTIQRAIRRASGEEGGADMQEIRYEGYGPGGVALIIDCFTDNPNRTVADVRHALDRHGGNLGTNGSVAFQFQRLGEIAFALDAEAGVTEEKVLEAALEAGADDLVKEDGEHVVICAPEDFEPVQQALIAAGLEPTHAGVGMRPDNRIEVTDAAVQDALTELLDELDALDDVSEVYHNAALDDDA